MVRDDRSIPCLSSVARPIALAAALLMGAPGCDRVVAWMDGAPAEVEAVAADDEDKPKRERDTKPQPLVPRHVVSFDKATVTGAPPRGAEDLAEVLAWLRTRAAVGETRDLGSRATARSVRGAWQPAADTTPLVTIAPPRARQLLAGEVRRVQYSGGRAAVTVRDHGAPAVLWFFLRSGRWLWDVAAPTTLLPADKGDPHPMNRPLSLGDATAGIHGTGPLVVVFNTTGGKLLCKLVTGRAQAAVAHFVGLTRGLRATLDHTVQPPVWSRAPVFDGTTLRPSAHPTLVRGGRELGPKASIGFTIEDDLSLSLRHDRPGVLGIASERANGGGGGLYFTLAATPELDDRYSIIGHCPDLELLRRVQRGASAIRVIRVTVQRGF